MKNTKQNIKLATKVIIDNYNKNVEVVYNDGSKFFTDFKIFDLIQDKKGLWSLRQLKE